MIKQMYGVFFAVILGTSSYGYGVHPLSRYVIKPIINDLTKLVKTTNPVTADRIAYGAAIVGFVTHIASLIHRIQSTDGQYLKAEFDFAKKAALFVAAAAKLTVLVKHR